MLWALTDGWEGQGLAVQTLPGFTLICPEASLWLVGDRPFASRAELTSPTVRTVQLMAAWCLL